LIWEPGFIQSEEKDIGSNLTENGSNNAWNQNFNENNGNLNNNNKYNNTNRVRPVSAHESRTAIGIV
jgi:hypothetical protein